jgi:hypothetical protein
MIKMLGINTWKINEGMKKKISRERRIGGVRIITTRVFSDISVRTGNPSLSLS